MPIFHVVRPLGSNFEDKSESYAGASLKEALLLANPDLGSQWATFTVEAPDAGAARLMAVGPTRISLVSADLMATLAFEVHPDVYRGMLSERRKLTNQRQSITLEAAGLLVRDLYSVATGELGLRFPQDGSFLDYLADNLPDESLSTLRDAIVVAGLADVVKG